MEVHLTNGGVALADDSDADLIGRHRWRRVRSKKSTTDYAATTVRTVNGKRLLLMHRLILAAKTGQIVDHANYDGLDNRRLNIRICTPRQNAANSRRSRQKSPYRGVKRTTAKSERWSACISSERAGRNIHLGSFGSAEEAARAYDGAAKERYGAFAVLNFPLTAS